MGRTRREFLTLAGFGSVLGLAGCVGTQKADDPATPSDPTDGKVDLEEFKGLALNMDAWKYDEDNDVYYQLGLAYCTKPATKTYESLAIFVPGGFFTGKQNGDVYSCEVNEKAVVGNFTPATAPVLMPVNTGTLSAQASPTSYAYAGLGPYLQSGCIYVYAGFRGRSAGYDTASGTGELFAGGSPWPVVDLKAAVRYLRYNAGSLPCDTSRVFVFGFGAGGGVCAVLGSSGNASEYEPYLSQIGAATHDATGASISDAVFGSASWCPVTSFDTADAAYEWASGQYAGDGTRAEGLWTRQLSQDLAGAYGAWVNEMDLRADDDTQLTLDETEAGSFAMGGYADALLSNVNDAASWFLQNTTFPYTYTPQRIDEPTFPGDPNILATRESEAAAAQTTSSATTADAAGDSSSAAGSADASATSSSSGSLSGVAQVQSTIYDTAQNYFAALNADYWWINYSLRTQTVQVSSLRDLALHLRPATRAASPFDLPDRSSRTNQLFGIGEESTLHFDAILAGLIEKNADAYAAIKPESDAADGTDSAGSEATTSEGAWNSDYGTAWQDDLQKTDALDTSMDLRVSMMNPLYWLSGHYDGYGQASVAPHWRINEGLFDTDVPLTCASNVVFALRKYDGVKDVAYTPVWGQGHVLAERSGSATTNLVEWVVACCA